MSLFQAKSNQTPKSYFQKIEQTKFSVPKISSKRLIKPNVYFQPKAKYISEVRYFKQRDMFQTDLSTLRKQQLWAKKKSTVAGHRKSLQITHNLIALGWVCLEGWLWAAQCRRCVCVCVVELGQHVGLSNP